MQQVTVNNANIQYLECGEPSKPTVIFVHGSASDYRTWETQLDAFADKYHVIAYSRRSHYPNAYMEYDQRYSVKIESDDLAQLIKNLELQTPVHLVGWSYGAFIALVTAQRYSSLIQSLVLAEPPIMSFLTAYASTEKLYLDYVSKVSAIPNYLNSVKDTAAVECFIDAVSGAGAFAHTPPEQQQRMLQNARTLYELTTVERDPFSDCDVTAIAQPTLLVSGEHSPLFLKKIIAELSSCLPVQESIVIKSAGHVMHRQNVDEYNKAVLKFLDKHPTA